MPRKESREAIRPGFCRSKAVHLSETKTSAGKVNADPISLMGIGLYKAMCGLAFLAPKFKSAVNLGPNKFNLFANR